MIPAPGQAEGGHEQWTMRDNFCDVAVSSPTMVKEIPVHSPTISQDSKSAIVTPTSLRKAERDSTTHPPVAPRVQSCLAPIWRASPISSLYSNVTSPNFPPTFGATSNSRVASHTAMMDQTYITGAFQKTTIGSTCAIAMWPSAIFRQ